jgi:murein DD-endopeptidase MepM/ murein hydrolase activator NlpD
MMKRTFFISLFLVFLLSGCAPAQLIAPTHTPTQTATVIPTATATATAAPAPTATVVPLLSEVCSPLANIVLEDLGYITSNPFILKYPFREGVGDFKNHPAIDLGFYHTSTIPHYTGEPLDTDDNYPIQAILPGKVVALTDDRFPYGNMIMIETPVESLSPDLLAQIRLPDPLSDEDIEQHSPCDQSLPKLTWDDSQRSIYALYAHMKESPTLKVGDTVICGQVIGTIGATGNSSESIEHLHLEVRVGPSHAQFGTIAFSSDTDIATDEERYNYCTWALSEVFYPIDPALFWSSSNSQK